MSNNSAYSCILKYGRVLGLAHGLVGLEWGMERKKRVAANMPATRVNGFFENSQRGRYTMPWAIMALATLRNPATLAPFT